MASPTLIFLVSLLLPFAFIAARREPCATAASNGGSNELSIIPINSKYSPFASAYTSASIMETVLYMASKDSHRRAYLAGKTSAPIGSGKGILNITGNYVVRVSLGTPPKQMFMVLDNSNDAVWLPCSGCSGCSSATYFNTKVSVTYRTLSCSTLQCTQARGLTCPSSSSSSSSCSFNQSYGGDSSFSASLVQDTLTLASDVIPNFSFGCMTAASGNSLPPQGLLGLGRGPTSLISQTTSFYSGVFSYCFPSVKSSDFSGSLTLGPSDQRAFVSFTPLLTNPHRPSLYYVNLTGVSVGSVQVAIESAYLEFSPHTGGGTIIDSGTVITRFVLPVYEPIRDEFRKQVKGLFLGQYSTIGEFDTCFPMANVEAVPKITLHFTGLDLTLPLENTLLHEGTRTCLSMAGEPPNNVDTVVNVIANLQQQNLRILFDIPSSRIGIVHESCN